jgi:signal transduction histidine kinase
MQPMAFRTPLHIRLDRRLLAAYGVVWLVLWSILLLSHLQTDLTKGLWRPWQAIYTASITLWPAMLLGALPWYFNAYQFSNRRWWVFHSVLAMAFSAAWLLLITATNYGLYGKELAVSTLHESFLWQFFWGLIVYAGLISALNFFLTARQSKANAVVAAQADAARVRAELSAVRGKLNPHFLFNTLNTLVALTRKDSQKAQDALIQFSGMLRYVLDSQRESQDRVPLAEEIEFSRDYLSLEQWRLGARLTVQWQVDETTLQCEVPILTLQPLVENAIIHGIAGQLQVGTVTISSWKTADHLHVRVADNGPGTSLPIKHNSKGIGLSALQQRFALDYNGHAQFDLISSPGQGFQVTIAIPL